MPADHTDTRPRHASSVSVASAGFWLQARLNSLSDGYREPWPVKRLQRVTVGS